MTATLTGFDTNFAQGILEMDEEEREKIFKLIEHNISNNDYNVHNYIKGTKGRNPEAGLVWIIRQLIEQQQKHKESLKESLSISFNSFVNNTRELYDAKSHNTEQEDDRMQFKEKTTNAPFQTSKQNIKVTPNLITETIDTNTVTKIY